MSKSKKPRVASAAATGGAGTFFEQHVGAYLLGLLLVRAPAPLLVDDTLTEVLFQTKHLGWQTDDFLVRARSADGSEHQLAGQVKRALTVSRSDEEFAKTIRSAWADFQTAGLFDPSRDKLAIVTLRGTVSLQVHFNSLLDCARASRDATDFHHRLETPGFLHQRVRHHFQEVRAILDATDGRQIDPDLVLGFLQATHLVVLDLTSSASQTEAFAKALLAHTACETSPSPRTDASNTWNALLRLAGTAMPTASSFRHEDLPTELRQRHGANLAHQRVLQAIQEHSAPILDRIHIGLGPTEIHVSRVGLVTGVLAALREHQVVLLSGPAGAGKSALARQVLDLLRPNYFTFALRAEELARPHIDETLLAAQVPANATQLASILVGQDHKILFIDSAERLLESATRDALPDLLEFARRDPTWRLLICCRDYASEDVRAAFLERSGLAHSGLWVPNLPEPELRQLETQLPGLRRVLRLPQLRQLLSNPFYLDLTSRVPWPADKPVPDTARALRLHLWREVIRKDANRGEGLPQRREAAFVSVALDRARALTPFVSGSSLDAVAVAALERDGLLATSPLSRQLVTPAHDVFEDWALLQWIEATAEQVEYSLQDLASEVGGHPALRRTYRRFLADLAARDPALASDLFRQAASAHGELPAHVCDDTLATLLLAPTSFELLQQQAPQIVADDQALWRRILHLLRVACMVPADWIDQSGYVPLFYAPAGPAWASMLGLLRSNLEAIPASDYQLVLGFLEDWARGVTWRDHYPPGAEEAVAVAHWLLERFSAGYDKADRAERALAIITKLPLVDTSRLLAIAQETVRERPSRNARRLLDMVLSGLEGGTVARDLPQEVVDLARSHWLLPEQERREANGPRWRESFDMEPLFGLRSSLNHQFFPPSAYRGPFLTLLRNHANTGLSFILELSNHCAASYAHSAPFSRCPESLPKIALEFADGASVTHWCNGRLWLLYRGASVGPHVLQCALMALEHWLLAQAEESPNSDLEAVLLAILRDSRSAATTAVVASVATAYPEQAGEALLVLLRSKACIQLDRSRLVHEGSSALLGNLLPSLAGSQFFVEERKQAAQRRHRTLDLEAAALNAQLTRLRDSVHDILDQHRAAIESCPQDNEDERIWRLALDRMDLRRHRITRLDPATLPQSALSEEARKAAEEGTLIQLQVADLDPDLQAMVDQADADRTPFESEIGLHVWGLGVFARDGKSTSDPLQWRERLTHAQSPRSDQVPSLLGDGRPYVAAVCVRDFWGELDGDERRWCVQTIASTIALAYDQRSTYASSGLTGTKEVALVLPALFGKALCPQDHAVALEALARALTHPAEDVVYAACNGVAEYLWATNPELATRCADSLALHGRLLDEALHTPRAPGSVRYGTLDELHAEESSRTSRLEAATLPRARAVVHGPNSDAGECDRHEATGSVGARTLVKLLLVYRNSYSDPRAHRLYSLAAERLARCWEPRAGGRRARSGPDAISHDTVFHLRQLLTRYVIRTSASEALTAVQPLLKIIDGSPRDAAGLARWLVLSEDSYEGESSFWELWQAMANQVVQAPWLDDIREDSGAHELVRVLFLGLATEWKEGVRRWPRMAGQEHRLHALAAALPRSAPVYEAYVGFFYALGHEAMPHGYVHLVECLDRGSEVQLACGNTVLMLEALLRRWVYGRPLEVKSTKALRDAVLRLLDALVENGSSAAYRMRDDFVTPLPAMAGPARDSRRG